MIKKIIKAAITNPFNAFGYDVTFSRKEVDSISIVDKNMWEPYFRFDHSMKLYFEGLKRSQNESSDNFYKQLRFYSLQQLVRQVVRQKLSGDFVECGVWKGHSAYLISSILSESGFSGDFHIFDSFEGGLSTKTEKDANLRVKLSDKQIGEEIKLFSSTEDEVRACLSDFNFFYLYKGWIPSRFNEVNERHFAFVHIDVDLYEPTLDSINFFYPKMVKDGVIVCDDYGLSQFPGAKKAIDDFLKINTFRVFYEIPMGGCFIIK